MPAAVERCVKHLRAKYKGKINPRTKKPYTDSEYWAICQSAAQRKEKSAEVVTKEFNYIAPVTKHYVQKNNEGEEQRFMEVTLSGVKEDRDGDRMSEAALKGMMEQLKSGRIPFFLDHGLDEHGERTYRVKDIAGKWIDGRIEGDNLIATVRLNNANSNAEVIWNYAKEGMPLGLSVGGKVIEKSEEVVEE